MRLKPLISATAIACCATAAPAQDAPFGTDADADYAQLLWDVMEAQKLVGDGMIRAFPYEGVEPHGLLLETFYSSGTVEGHSGELIVKRNFGPEGVTSDEVLGNPEEHMQSITIMFRREEGFDPGNQNWFWAKYLPDGTLDRNPKDMRLAGRVAKGADQGCIACHSGSDNYLFTNPSIQP